jgi:hypothetical protein
MINPAGKTDKKYVSYILYVKVLVSNENDMRDYGAESLTCNKS